MGSLLETAAHDPYGAYIVGASILIALLIGLNAVLRLGKTRPHS
jgi:hypothetical protein